MGLPMLASLKVSFESIANPKSAIFGMPFLERNILATFISRCIMLFFASYSNPLKTPKIINLMSS